MIIIGEKINMFIDPLDEKMMALLQATQVIMGQDDFCCNYLGAYRKGKLL